MPVSRRYFRRRGQRLELRCANHPLPRVPGIVRRFHPDTPGGGAPGSDPELFHFHTAGNSAGDLARQFVRPETCTPRRFEWQKLKPACPVRRNISSRPGNIRDIARDAMRSWSRKVCRSGFGNDSRPALFRIRRGNKDHTPTAFFFGTATFADQSFFPDISEP
jgi:hypothetical protein